MTRSIHHTWRAGARLGGRYLDEFPIALGHDDGDRLVLLDHGREVKIHTDHPRSRPGSYVVTIQDGATEHWADVGPDYPAACRLADDVLTLGAAVYETIEVARGS